MRADIQAFVVCEIKTKPFLSRTLIMAFDGNNLGILQFLLNYNRTIYFSDFGDFCVLKIQIKGFFDVF